jgi:hypothetical protein
MQPHLSDIISISLQIQHLSAGKKAEKKMEKRNQGNGEASR